MIESSGVDQVLIYFRSEEGKLKKTENIKILRHRRRLHSVD